MSHAPHRLEIAEYVFLAGSVVGTIAAALSGQVIYAALPLSASLLLNLINRHRFERLLRQSTNAGIMRYRQLLEDIEALYASVEDLPSVSTTGSSGTVQQVRAALSAEMQDCLALLVRNNINPIYQNITELQEQCVSLQKSLASIGRSNAASVSAKVEHLEQTLNRLKQGITDVSAPVDGSVPGQLNTLKEQFLAFQRQSEIGNRESAATVEQLRQALIHLSEKITSISDRIETVMPDRLEEDGKATNLQIDTPALVRPPAPLPVERWQCSYTIKGHSDWVSSVVISPDGRTLIGGSFDRTIKIWNLQTGEPIQTLCEDAGPIYAIALAPDGKTLVSGSAAQNIKLWNLDAKQPIYTFWEQLGSIRSVAISSICLKEHSLSKFDRVRSEDEVFMSGIGEGGTIASGHFDQTIKLWDLNTKQLINTLTGHLGAVGAVAFSPDGEMLASGSADGTLKIWHWQKGELLRSLTGNLGIIGAIAWSPNGQILASASSDKTIQLWYWVTGEQINVLTGHAGAVTAVAFCPDGETLVSGSADGTLKIWHWHGELLTVLNGGNHPVLSVAIAPEKSSIVSGSADGTIKIWHRC